MTACEYREDVEGRKESTLLGHTAKATSAASPRLTDGRRRGAVLTGMGGVQGY